MTINGYVWWSVYVRTGSVRKLRTVHLPAIDSALGVPEFEWQIVREDENPGLIRIVNYQNLKAECVKDLIVPVLLRAYRLGNNWHISGLCDLEATELKYVYGAWTMHKPRPSPPAIESMVFEMMPGQVSGMRTDGGWELVDQPGHILMAPSDNHSASDSD